MSGINLVILVGNLGDEPQVRYDQGGNPIANISLATTETWKDRNNEKQQATEWHRVVFFGKLAGVAEQYLHKGDKVYIEGSIRTNKWQDNEGNQRQSTEIRGRKLQMLGSPQNKQSAPSQQHQRYQGPQQGQQQGQGFGGQGQRQNHQQGQGYQGPQQGQGYGGPPNTNFDDDIPF